MSVPVSKEIAREHPLDAHYMIVIYEGAKAILRCSSGGPWRADSVEKGVISLLTRDEQSIWRWDRSIRVKHIYFGQEIIEETAKVSIAFLRSREPTLYRLTGLYCDLKCDFISQLTP
jgi:hypothetical protein